MRTRFTCTRKHLPGIVNPMSQLQNGFGIIAFSRSGMVCKQGALASRQILISVDTLNTELSESSTIVNLLKYQLKLMVI